MSTSVYVVIQNPEQQATNELLRQILCRLNDLEDGERTIIMNEQDAIAILKKIDDASTASAKTTAAEAANVVALGENMGKISDGLDALILKSQQTPGLSGEFTAQLQTLSEHAAAQEEGANAVAASLQKQVEFANALASKGISKPVPIDPAPPSPPIDPIAPIVPAEPGQAPA